VHPVATQFLSRIITGLTRASITSCADWAIQYRVVGMPFPGQWTFRHHPWLKAMHDSTAPLNVGQKAAQMGYTELLLNWSFYTIDVLRESVLYILPTDSDASDFSASRFDPALESSKHLRNLFSDVKNVGLKRAGTATLYVRGSRSRSKLKSIPAGKICFDEFDEMQQESVQLGLERASGQVNKQTWMISTPTVDGHGIAKEYSHSTQEHFFFLCPHCGRHVELIFPDCLIVTATDLNDPRINDSYIKCPKCASKLNHSDKINWLAKGKWVPGRESEIRGFYINQLYSPAKTPVELANLSIRAQTDPIVEQEFYNSNGGLPHIASGNRLTDAQINACRSIYSNVSEKPDGLITLGADVGGKINLQIAQWVMQGKNLVPRVICFTTVKEFEEIDKFVEDYNVSFSVIDANPENRSSKAFCARHPGRAAMCFYTRTDAGRDITWDEEEMTIKVCRTNWLDTYLSRYKRGEILIPADTTPDFVNHMKACIRVTRFNKDKELRAFYVNDGPDHYAHSGVYMELAHQMYLGGSVNKNIKTPVI